MPETGTWRHRRPWLAAVAACVTFVLVAIGLVVAAERYLDAGLRLRPDVMVVAAVIGCPAALGAYAWLHRLRRRPLVAPQPIGLTADIVEDMGNRSWGTNWMRYGFDGEDLSTTSVADDLRAAGRYADDLTSQLRQWAAGGDSSREVTS